MNKKNVRKIPKSQTTRFLFFKP